MSVSCLKNLTTGHIISAINSVAYFAYADHKGGKQFTVEEQRVIYNNLLDTIANDLFDGNVSSLLTRITTADKYGQLEIEASARDFFMESFEELGRAIADIRKFSPSAKFAQEIYRFPAAVVSPVGDTSFYMSVLNNYIGKNTIKPAGTTLQVDPALTQDEASSVNTSSQVNESETISSLFKRLFGEMNKKHIDPALAFFNHTVATTWVDGRVGEDGYVQGYTGLKSVANKVKSQLQERIYNFFAVRSNGTFSTTADGIETKYIVFNSNRIPVGYRGTSSDGTVGVHQDFKYMTLPGGTKVEVNFILAEDMNSAMEKIAGDGVVYSNETPNESTEDDFTKITFTNPDLLAKEDLPVYYAHVLTTGNNYPVFLKANFVVLDKAYKDGTRRSYAEPGATSGDDQDSAALKLHKEATPRLVVSPNNTISVDKSSPYLTTEDFNLVAQDLSSMSSDMITMAGQILSAAQNASNSHKQSILYSIYYRFFSPTDYQVNEFQDLTTAGTKSQMLRSYLGILNTQKIDPLTVEEYETLKDRSILPKSTNSLLQDSLSALVTSFRSIQNQELLQEINGRARKTNVANQGININGFNTDFVENTTHTTAAGIFTMPKFMKNDRVVIENLTGKGKVPKVRISIMSADKKSKTVYDADVNISKDENQKESFTNGIPLTITNINKKLNTNETARLFRGFGFPESITLDKYLPTVIESLRGVKGINEKNYGKIDTVDGKSLDFTLDNMYLNMLFSMVLNGDPSKYSVVRSARQVAHVPSAETGLAYNPIEMFHGYKDSISDIILRTEGELGRKYIVGFNNEKLATKASTSHIKLTSTLAERVEEGSLHYGNVLTSSNRQYEVLRETYVKGGIKIGDKHKNVLNMTPKENAMFSIESAFLQTAARSTKFNQAMFQIGAQSDRLHPQFTEFRAFGDKSMLFLKDEKTGGLDTKTLAEKTLFVHKNYYTNVNKVATAEWNTALNSLRPGQNKKAKDGIFNYTSLQEVADYLEDNPIVYNDAKAESELTDQSMLEKDGDDNDSFAKIPESTLQSIAIFSNDTLGLQYIETMRKMFLNQLREAGYTAISNISREAMGKVMGDSKISVASATSTLFDAYFYTSQILGVSALNIHTGGLSQYDLKGKAAPMFNTKESFKNGELNVKSIIKQAKALKVPGSKLLLGKISPEELLALREKSTEPGILNSYLTKLDRLAYMKAIMERDLSDEIIARNLIFNDLTRQLDSKFVNQVKRNQVLGSGLQLPRIAHTNEPGFFLGKSVKTITVADNKVNLKSLGMSGEGRITATDGVQMLHPLSTIRMNNSIGNNESSFKYNGVAIKSLTIDNDKRGVARYQKKAEFGSMSDDLLRKGSPELDQMLRKMNTAITFESKHMLIDPKGEVVWSAIDENLWKKHGVSFGPMKFTDESGSYIIDATAVLNSIRSSNDAREQFRQQLENGQWESAKAERMFNNMQELWEFFGAHTNPNAWNQVGELIGNHSGIGTTDIALTDAKYPNRDAYIDKVGYTSQEKTGTKNVLTWENFLNNDYKFDYTDALGNHHQRWSEVSNEHHGLILQAEHGYDTTVSNNALDNDSSTETHDSEVSLITQIISAASAEGISVRESWNISNTLNALSRGALDGLNKKVVNLVIKAHPELASKRDLLLSRLEKGPEDTSLAYEDEISDAWLTFCRELMSKTLSKKQEDPGLAAELLSSSNLESLTLDQKQLLPLFQSQLFADYNTRAVKMKLAGGQYVVSPSHQFMPTYDLKLGTQTILTGMTREDMNRHFYGDNYTRLKNGSLQKNAINASFPLKNITDPTRIKLSDIVVDTTGKPREFVDIKNELREVYNTLIGTEGAPASFEEFLNNELLTKDYQYRFGNITPKDEKRLEWAQWKRYTTNVNEQNITGSSEQNVFDTPEYKAYAIIEPLGKAYLGDKTFDQFFKLDLTKPLKSVKPKLHPKTFEPLGEEIIGLVDDIKKVVPGNLIREYYFGVVSKPTSILPFPTAMITPIQDQEYIAWVNKQNPVKLLESVYNYMGKQASEDPKFKERFKSYLYNLLQDESKGWVSTAAEMYMPHMQAKTFFLKTGEDGGQPDTLFDITGMNELPSTNKLESLKILSHADAVEFSFNYDEAFRKFKTEPTGKYHTLPTQAAKDMFDEYDKQVRNLRDKMTSVFQERVSKVYGTRRRRGIDPKKIGSANNLFVFNGTTLDQGLYEAINKRNISAVDGAHYNSMNQLIKSIEAEKALVVQGLSTKDLSDLVQDARRNFINSKVKTLTNNFQKTLQFITARIPAQGKSYFTTGQIKNFVFSSKNSVYGPLELILLAGLDYDIDKQNMMTWAVDKDGTIIDWNPYMDDQGKMSLKKLDEKIKAHTATIEQNFARLIAKAEADLANADDSTIIEAELKVSRTKENMEKAIERSEAADRLAFTKAGQNFIVHNLIEVISSPKNAIESSTPSSMDKAAGAVELPKIEGLFKAGTTLEDILTSQQITSNVNPFSTFQYEKLNMDGKSGISIYASDLKSYLASYYATRVATEDEKRHVVLKSDLLEMHQSQKDRFGINSNALQFFKSKVATETLPWKATSTYAAGTTIKKGKYVYTAQEDVPSGTDITNTKYWKLEPVVVTMEYISNAAKWGEEGVKMGDDAKTAMTELKKLDPADTDGQTKIINDYLNSVQGFSSMNVDRQAWEELSQLLSASTDNAKELILGKIGANNTTNSLISTMIRMGVDIRDALKVINDPKIKEIVKKIEASTDLKTKHEKTAQLAEEGIIQQEEYGTRLLDALKAALPSPPGVDASDTAVFDYLTDPARILYTHAKAAFEFSILAKLLSINQGLKNSAFDVYNYIESINNAVNKSIEDYNKANKEDKIDLTFDLAKFVYAASKENVTDVDKVLDAMNKIRTGINIPFVLVKNAHYFGYFEAMLQAKSVRDRLSFVNKYAENIIKSTKQIYGYRAITEPIYKKLSDTIYEFGVLRYLDDPEAGRNLITLRGIQYDLSKPKGDNKVGGRFELLQNLPEILETLDNNAFANSLKLDSSHRDPMTGESVKLLKGRNLALVKSDELARLQIGLEDIRLTDPELYDALFLYSLITTKGSYSGGSYVGLFPIEKYLDFSKFLKKDVVNITNKIDTNTELIALLNPLLLPQVSTIAKTETMDPTEENETDSFIGDLYSDESTDFSDVGGNYTTPAMALNNQKFVLDGLNDLRKENKYLKYDYVRSKDNGLVYQWDENLEIYIPLTRVVPELAIPYTLPRNAGMTVGKMTGYLQGFEINLPYYGPNEKGTVIAYITRKMKTRALDPATSGMSIVMLDLMKDPRAKDKDINSYIIRDNHGNLSVSVKEDLEKSNPGFEFDQGRIATASKTMEAIETKIKPTRKLFVKDTSYYSEPTEGALPIDVVIEKAARSTSSVIFDEDTVKSIISAVEKPKLDTTYTSTRAIMDYDAYEDQLVDNVLAAELGIDYAGAHNIRVNLRDRSQAEQSAVKIIRKNIAYRLGEEPSMVAKLNILLKGYDGFVELFTSMQPGKKMLSSPDIKFPSKDTIPVAAYEFINTNEVISNLDKIGLGEFKDLIHILKVPESIFDKYIEKTYIPESGVDAVVMPNGRVYIHKNDKISASKQLTALNDKVVKEKPIYLPPSMRYEYSRPAGREVFWKLVKYLNAKLPGVKWTIMTSEEIKNKYGNKYMSDKGFFKADGQVVINIDKATMETPLHEFGHVYLQYLMAADPQEYQRVMQLAKEHDLFDTMGNTYKGLSSTDLAEEVFCELLSMSATNQLMLNKDTRTADILTSMSDTKSKFGRVLEQFKNWIKSLFGIETGIDTTGYLSDIELNMSDSLSNVIDKLTDNIVFGEKSFLSDVTDTTKDNLRKLRTASTLSVKEAKDVLLSRGYIEWFCVS